MELGPRDRLSQAFWHEQQKGLTVDSKWGPVVNLDLRHLGEKLINERLPFVRDLAKSYVGVDMVDAPGPGAPGGPLHDGRHRLRQAGRDPCAGAVCRRRMCVRQHQRREPARIELAH